MPSACSLSSVGSAASLWYSASQFPRTKYCARGCACQLRNLSCACERLPCLCGSPCRQTPPAEQGQALTWVGSVRSWIKTYFCVPICPPHPPPPSQHRPRGSARPRASTRTYAPRSPRAGSAPCPRHRCLRPRPRLCAFAPPALVLPRSLSPSSCRQSSPLCTCRPWHLPFVCARTRSRPPTTVPWPCPHSHCILGSHLVPPRGIGSCVGINRDTRSDAREGHGGSGWRVGAAARERRPLCRDARAGPGLARRRGPAAVSLRRARVRRRQGRRADAGDAEPQAHCQAAGARRPRNAEHSCRGPRPALHVDAVDADADLLPLLPPRGQDVLRGREKFAPGGVCHTRRGVLAV